MNKRPYRRRIRDRVLSLFAALSVFAGIITGFATAGTVGAKAESFTKQIETGGEITYTPAMDGSSGTVVYKKTHNKATSDIQYYTKHFILSLGTVNLSDSLKPYDPDDPTGKYKGEGIPKWDLVKAGDEKAIEYAKKYKAVMVDLQFAYKDGKAQEGVSLSKDEAEAGGYDFCWWDEVGQKIVTTTYKFDASAIFEFIEEFGELETSKVYISHIFALKWADSYNSSDYIGDFERYREYWTPNDIIYGVSWNAPPPGETSTQKKIEGCYNVEVPLSWNAVTNVYYYDIDTKQTVYWDEGVENTKVYDASVDNFTVTNPTINIKGRVPSQIPGVAGGLGSSWATVKSSDNPPIMITSKGLTTWWKQILTSLGIEYALKTVDEDIAAAKQKAVIAGKSADDYSKYQRIKKHNISSAFKDNYGKDFEYTVNFSGLSKFTRTVNIYVPVAPAGSTVYYNFYDFDSGKGIPGTMCYVAGSYPEGYKDVTIGFFVPSGLTDSWQLKADGGAFEVSSTSVNDVDTYGEAKNHSSKKTGTYNPSGLTYGLKEEKIKNGMAYVVWIPLVKKAPKRTVWVGYYDTATQTQVGSVHKASDEEEGKTNVAIDVSLPAGESLPDGYTFAGTGAFDISDGAISTYKQYSYAKNYSAKRNGSYSYPTYTVSKIDSGKDVIIWVPVSKGGASDPVKVYVRYITVDGKTNLKETTAPDATLGTAYTYSAETSIVKDGVPYVLAPETKYGSRPPKAVYSTVSDNLAGTKYTTTRNVTALSLTRDDTNFGFTASAAGTKAVKIFIPMIPKKGNTNVRIVYIDSQTGNPVGSMVERNDMERGDTIIPSSTLPSGYTVDLSDTAPYKRLAVYKEGSTGIQSDYNQAKSKITSGAVQELAFNGNANCNCDIPMSDAENLAVKVFVPVKQTITGTMLVVKYFYVNSSGKYKQIDSRIMPNYDSPTGKYAWGSNYTVNILSSVYSDGKVYEPSYCEGMLYGNSNELLVASTDNYSKTSSKTRDDGVYGSASAFLEGGSGNSRLNFSTAEEGNWHTAYVICNEKITSTKLVIHYIDAESGAEIYKKSDSNYLSPINKRMTWGSIEGNLTWTYSLSGALDKTVMSEAGETYAPIYFDNSYVTEHECRCTDIRDHFFMNVEDDGSSGYMWAAGYCTTCGAIVRYINDSLYLGRWQGTTVNTYDHSVWRTYSYPSSYKKTRIKVATVGDSQLASYDSTYDECSNTKFNFWVNSDNSFSFYVKSTDDNELGYGLSSSDGSPEKRINGDVMILYVPCVKTDGGKSYNVNVKYITLKSDGTADKVVAEADGGKANVGEFYTYTGASSVTKDGVTYTVLGRDEWLAYGSNKYGQAKGDTSNTKGNPAEYDEGTSWTTKKIYSQEKDGTLYIPVAEGGMTVTVKYVVVKSNKTIKKTVKEVFGGVAEYNKKFKYTGDVIVTDSSGKEYAVVGSGDALAYGTNSYKDALNDTGNTKGHKSKFDGIDKWTSEKKYNSHENGVLYIPVKEAVPVTVYYFTPPSGGGCSVGDHNVKLTEAAAPGIPGEHYKTVIRSTVVVDGATYVIKTTPSPMPVTGTYPYGVLSAHKIWWDRTAPDIKSGTTVETDIPADVDEYYIIVPIEKIGTEDPDVPEPDPDKGKKVLDDEPTAVVKSDIYDVVKAIPSTEDIYTEVKAKQYLYAFNAKNYTGQKKYTVTVKQNITVVSADDPDVVISSSDATKSVDVYRNYSYWTVDSFMLYVPDKGYVLNMSLNTDAEMEAKFSGSVPTITKTLYGAEANHITEPTYNTSYTMTATTITEGDSYDFDTVASAYASSQIGEIKCKNDYFKFGNKVVLSDTQKDTAADAPTISNLPDASDIPSIDAKSGNYKIPGEMKNVKYDSAGRVVYVLKENVGDAESDMEKQIANINSVKVHTPVLAKLTIAEDNLKYVQDVNADKTKAHAVVGRSDSDGSEGYENSTSDFTLDINLNGKHISEKGYGTRTDYDKYVVGYGTGVNGTSYPKGVMVMFDFDVMADVNNDKAESNDILLKAGSWNRVYPSYYVPEWVEPGTHKVKVCVYAVNAEGDEDKEQKNKNTTDTNYVAFDEAEIEISGKVYGLTLTSNTSTAPDWKDVFLSSGRIKWSTPNKYPDGTYLDGFDKSKMYYYMTGIKNELGLDMKTLVSQTVKVKGKNTVVTTTETKRDRYIFPLIDGSSPATKGTGTLKSGYTWNFQISTAGRVTANDNSTLVIVPTFYWIGSSGTKREKVDVWYSGKVDGKTYNFIKVGSDLDKKNVFSDYALSETMGIPKSELSMVETLRGDKKVLQANTNIYTYGMISLGRNTKTFPNETYVSLFKNKGTGYTENQLMQFRQNWYFKYSMPDVYHVCAAGTDVEAYAKKNGGVTYKEDFWKKKGFLVIHFDIGVYDKNGKLVLTYTNTAQNVADGMCDMWAMEGYQNNRTDTNGNNFTFVDGDVILLRLPGSTTPGTPDDPDDPPVTPTPTPTPGTPGDPNPPTNSSEDKQVNRTN